jgi:peptidoglycan/xylan/chitin deacetylase (PgdA/CDA1 family)
MATRAYITTSWDDGHIADLRVAELLSRYQLTGTFYIPRSIETGVMPVAQIRELSDRFEVGAHTLDHVFLNTVDLPAATAQIEGSKRWVEDVTGRPCAVFCPPAGKYDQRHVRAMAAAGYRGFRTVEFMSLDSPRRTNGSPLMEMPTTLQAFDQPPAAFAKNALKRRAPANLWRYVVHGRASRDWGVLARRLLDRTLESGGVFHL